MSDESFWTMDGIPLDSNGIPLKAERYCPRCSVWYSGPSPLECYMCGAKLEAVAREPETVHLLHSERALAERVAEQLGKTSTQAALAAQVEYLETQRRHLLGQVHAIEEWLKHLRGGAAKRDDGRLKASGGTGYVPSDQWISESRRLSSDLELPNIVID